MLLALSPIALLHAQEQDAFAIARVKYRGGGDWYNDPSSLENLIDYAAQQLPITIQRQYDDVALGSGEINQYPFLFLTGHGTISVNSAEAENMRSYLNNGGFLYIDDDYGLDEYARKVIDAIYPDEKLVPIPFEHPIYHSVFDFNDGPPKIHAHDNKPAQGFGIFKDGRLVIYYTYECNLGDGWADPDIHKDPPSIRQKALRMGTNILVYALTR